MIEEKGYAPLSLRSNWGLPVKEEQRFSARRLRGPRPLQTTLIPVRTDAKEDDEDRQIVPLSLGQQGFIDRE